MPNNNHNNDRSSLPDLPSVWEDSGPSSSESVPTQPPSQYEQEHLRRGESPSAPGQGEQSGYTGPFNRGGTFSRGGPVPTVGCTGGGGCCVLPCFGCGLVVVFLLTSGFGILRALFSGAPIDEGAPSRQAPTTIPAPRERNGEPLPPPR